MNETYVPLVSPPADRRDPALWFIFRNAEILVVTVDEAPTIPCCMHPGDHGLTPVRSQYLGLYRGTHCYAAEVARTEPLPAGLSALGLRDLFATVDRTLATLSGRAFQLLDWERNQQHCGRCGALMRPRGEERSRKCPDCGYTSYPPVSPATMVLVTRGRELLLARKAGWPEGRYSALAGFVEPGEMLEDTVRRETMEEVGVEVKNIRYFGSQPWPFPHSLMVAFTAEHAGGEIRPDGVEISDARWFPCDALPARPGTISISRRLIDTTAQRLARGGADAGEP